MKGRFKVIQGGRVRRSTWRRKFFVAVIVALSLYLLWNSLTYLSLLVAKAEIVRHTVYRETVPLQVLVLKEEKLLVAPVAGRYQPLTESGQRVRVGQQVGAIAASGQTVLVPATSAGIINHRLDGLEGQLVPVSSLDVNAIARWQQLLHSPPVFYQVDQVGAGEGVASVMEPTRVVLAGRVDTRLERVRYRVGIDDQGGQLEFQVNVRDQVMVGNDWWVLLETSLPAKLALERRLDGWLVLGSAEVVWLPEKTLYNQGELGVFVLHHNRPVFNPVEVHARDGQAVAVLGLVDGQQVLILPRWARFIKRWWLR